MGEDVLSFDPLVVSVVEKTDHLRMTIRGCDQTIHFKLKLYQTETSVVDSFYFKVLYDIFSLHVK